MIQVKERQPLFIQLVSRLQKMSAIQFKIIADDAEITVQTLNNWAWGETFNPHLNTVIRVSKAMGYEITLQKKEVKRKPLRSVKKAA